MSGPLAGKVWDSDLAADLKPLAAMLADIAAHDGTRIYPSVEYMAWRLGRCPRSVQQGLSELRKLGVLVIMSGGKGGRCKSTTYRMLEGNLPRRDPWKPRNGLHGFAEGNNAVCDSKPRSLRHETMNHGSPESLVEPSMNRKPRAQSRSARNDFDEEMEKRRCIEAQQKRLQREEQLQAELNVGAGPEVRLKTRL
jgi:hypothetical protein